MPSPDQSPHFAGLSDFPSEQILIQGLAENGERAELAAETASARRQREKFPGPGRKTGNFGLRNESA